MAGNGGRACPRSSESPSATYRLQLRREFPLAAATALVSYLRQLGVSDLYRGWKIPGSAAVLLGPIARV